MNQKEIILDNTELHLVLCSPLGSYPMETIAIENNGLFVHKKAIFLAYDNSVPHSKEKLLASLLLSGDFSHGFFKPYFFPFLHTFKASNESNNCLAENAIESIETKIKERFVQDGDIIPEFDHYQNAKGASLPLVLNGVPYHQVDNLMDQNKFEGLYKKIGNSDYENLYDITELLAMSSQLSCHFQFQQQASLNLLNALVLYLEAPWANKHPKLMEWSKKLFDQSANALSKKLKPIEYVNLYKRVILSVASSI